MSRSTLTNFHSTEMYPIGHNIQYPHTLKDEIYKRGYTINSFAERVGISRYTLNNIFTGRHKPRGDTMSWIAQALDLPYERVVEICSR